MTKTIHFHWENRFVLQWYGVVRKLYRFVSCSFLRCFRCSFPCVFSLVYIVIVFVRCFICSFNRTVSFRSALKIALELVSISRQWQLQP